MSTAYKFSDKQIADSELDPCPFCGGPPVATVNYTCGVNGNCSVDCTPPDFSSEVFVEGFVFCHECGAQGPSEETLAVDQEDIEDLYVAARKLWQDRSQKNIELHLGRLRDIAQAQAELS